MSCAGTSKAAHNIAYALARHSRTPDRNEHPASNPIPTASRNSPMGSLHLQTSAYAEYLHALEILLHQRSAWGGAQAVPLSRLKQPEAQVAAANIRGPHHTTLI